MKRETYSEGWWDSVAHYSGKVYSTPPDIDGLIFNRDDMIAFAYWVMANNVLISNNFPETEEGRVVNNVAIDNFIKYRDRGL